MDDRGDDDGGKGRDVGRAENDRGLEVPERTKIPSTEVAGEREISDTVLAGGTKLPSTLVAVRNTSTLVSNPGNTVNRIGTTLHDVAVESSRKHGPDFTAFHEEEYCNDPLWAWDPARR